MSATFSTIQFTAKPKIATADVVIVDGVVNQLKHLDGALMPILHGVQAALGYIPEAAVPQIAKSLILSRAEVHGVVTYYDHFHQSPQGKTVVQVCRAEACQSLGGEQLLNDMQAEFGCGNKDNPHEHTSKDGLYTVEAAYCLGLCASSPAAMVNGKPYARLNATKLKNIVKNAANVKASNTMVHE